MLRFVPVLLLMSCAKPIPQHVLDDHEQRLELCEARLAALEKTPRVIQVENMDLSVYPVEKIPYQKVNKP